MVKVSGKGVKKKPVVGAAPVRKLQAGIAADLQVELTPGAYALWREQLVIWLAFGGLALGAYVSGFDSLLAVWLGSLGRSGFGADVAWFLRQYGTWLGAILALVCLLVIMIPKIFARWRVVYPTALLVVVVALFGGGLLNQVMIQELADRPRPRESVLLATPVAGAELSGNSMPSGHAAMGFLLMVPFFTLRRREWGRYKHAAQGFLMGGVVAGLVVGIGRMLAGAHFL
ncbi:MAG: phosphatase PAP2 family protein, partial [Proteobacteria bacterium]|nr:phosphatase PAP2 family protein [Pseudomonadota bacterium]